VDILNKNKILLIIYLVILVHISFIFKMEIFSTLNFTSLNFLIFFLSCFVGAYSIIFVTKDIKKILFQESKDELELTKSKQSKNEITALFIFILFSVITWNLNNRTSLLSLFILLSSIIISSSFMNHLVKIKNYVLRYLLEIPKLYVSFLIIGIDPNLSVITMIIGIGSLLYSIVPRGLFLLEILLGIIFKLKGYSMIELLSFIILNRILGTLIFNTPYAINKIIGKWQSLDKK
jgi:hypothetical protein